MDDIDSLVDTFNTDFETIGTITTTFAQKLKKLMDLREIEEEEFIEEVGLTDTTLQNYLNGTQEPSLKSLTQFCFNFDFDINTFYELLRAGGYSINYRKKKHCAYEFIITNFRGRTIQECNEFLKKVGLKGTELLNERKKI